LLLGLDKWSLSDYIIYMEELKQMDKRDRSKVFDAYRMFYNYFSFETLKAINNRLCEVFDEQSSFNFDMFMEIFRIAQKEAGRTLRVIELGSFKGELKNKVTESVEFWIGYDLFPCSDVELVDYFYNTEIPDADLFVCTHTFEHMSFEEVQKCVKHIKGCEFAAIEIPLRDSWNGYNGTHVLEASREDIIRLFSENGFEMFFDKMYYRDWWVSGYRRK